MTDYGGISKSSLWVTVTPTKGKTLAALLWGPIYRTAFEKQLGIVVWASQRVRNHRVHGMLVVLLPFPAHRVGVYWRPVSIFALSISCASAGSLVEMKLASVTPDPGPALVAFQDCWQLVSKVRTGRSNWLQTCKERSSAGLKDGSHHGWLESSVFPLITFLNRHTYGIPVQLGIVQDTSRKCVSPVHYRLWHREVITFICFYFS